MSKKNKSILWFAPELGAAEKKRVLAVLDSNYINDGKLSRVFESKIADMLKIEHCVAVTSGTAAIALVLMALGVGRDDEVIVPDLTFIATANAVRLAGAKVRLADIEPSRFSINVQKVSDQISSRTRAIVAVDVNGRAADYFALERIAKEKGLFLICDSTEGLGSKFKGRYLGTFGDAGCFSFSANKTITTGQGGMIATNNTKLYYRLLELKDQGRRIQGTGGDDLHTVLGFNFKFTDLQAAVGLAQLEKLTARLKKSKQRDAWYQEFLAGYPGISLPSLYTKEREVTQWTDVLIEDRSRVIAALNRKKIGYRCFWHSIHRQLPYKQSDAAFMCSVSVSERGLWLPSYFGLTKEEAQDTAKTILRALCQK